MALIVKITRNFSTTKRLKLYSHDKHLQTVGQGKRLEALNKAEEVMNEFNTDLSLPYGKQK